MFLWVQSQLFCLSIPNMIPLSLCEQQWRTCYFKLWKWCHKGKLKCKKKKYGKKREYMVFLYDLVYVLCTCKWQTKYRLQCKSTLMPLIHFVCSHKELPDQIRGSYIFHNCGVSSCHQLYGYIGEKVSMFKEIWIRSCNAHIGLTFLVISMKSLETRRLLEQPSNRPSGNW